MINNQKIGTRRKLYARENKNNKVLQRAANRKQNQIYGYVTKDLEGEQMEIRQLYTIKSIKILRNGKSCNSEVMLNC